MEWRAKQKFHGTRRRHGSKQFLESRGTRFNGREDRRFLHRCVKLAELHKKGKLSEDVNRSKRHHTGMAGRPPKAEELRRSLFQWFASFRRCVKGRFGRALLVRQAEFLRREALLEAARAKVYVDLPEITSRWVKKFMKDYRISLRSPCTSFKVPRHVFLERCRICWKNVYRARLFILKNKGYDPEIECFDQTPFHFNESGSKAKKVLDFTGKKKVTLKECHAATRARWTATTYTTTSTAAGCPPLEAMFKGGAGVRKSVQECLDALRASGQYGALPNVTVTTSKTGSYKLDDILEFLEKHLEPWGEGRRWKILLCDAFRPHLCKEVQDLCWSRGYLVVYIGGGCTGAQQVNDTHLHGPMSREYQDLEMELLAHAQENNPHGLKTMTREDCLGLLLITYERPTLHERASRGYAENLFTIPLEPVPADQVDCSAGSEQAKEIFRLCGMPEELQLLVSDVNEEYSAGRLPLTQKAFQSLMEEMPTRGHVDVVEDEAVEGYGGDDDDAMDQPLWSDEPLLSDEEAEEGKNAADQSGCSKSLAPAGSPGACLEQAQVDEALHYSTQIGIVDACIAHIGESGPPNLMASAKRARKQLMQRAQGKQQLDAKVAQAVRRVVEEQDAARRLSQAQSMAQAAQKSAIKSEKEAIKTERAEMAQREREFIQKLQERKRVEAIERALLSWHRHNFSSEKDGAGTPDKARRNRHDALLRVLKLCPNLDPARLKSYTRDFAVWDAARESFFRKCSGGALAQEFHKRLVHLMGELAAGRESEVVAWWEAVMRDYPLGPSALVMPALPAPKEGHKG